MRLTALVLLSGLAGCVGTTTPIGPGAQDMGSDVATNDAALPDGGRDVGVTDGGDTEDLSDVDRDEVTAVAIAGGAVCSLRASGRTACWGANLNQLVAADDDRTPRRPVWMGTAFTFSALDGGSNHFCGIQDGDVLCWGDNKAQQISPSNDAVLGTPLRVVTGALGGGAAVSVSAGDETSCASFEDGVAVCWGHNADFGADPGGNEGEFISPTAIGEVQQVASISTGFAYSCVLQQQPDNFLRCWGSNSNGEAAPNSPSPVTMPSAPSPQRFTALDTGEFTCGVTDGEVECWGENVNGRLGVPETVPTTRVPGITDVVDVAVGVTHACALTAVGAVFCWGEWKPGAADAPREFVSDGDRPFVAIAAGYQMSCAATAADVRCWGSNASGAVGQFEADGTPIADVFDEPQVVSAPVEF